MTRLVFLCTVLCLSMSSIYALTNNIMDLLYVDHIECKFSPNLCKNTICTSKFHNRTAKSVIKLATINCYPVVPFESVQVRTTLHYRFTGGYRQFAIKVKSDWCKFVDGSEKSILLDLWMKYIDGYTNINRKCPLIGNLTLDSLPMSSQIYGGQFLPAGDYYHQSAITANGAHLLTCRMYFTIPSGQTVLDDAMGK